MNALVMFFTISIGLLMLVSTLLLAFNHFNTFKKSVKFFPSGGNRLPNIELGAMSSSVPTIHNKRLRAEGESLYAAVRASLDARFAEDDVFNIVRNLK